jgi:AhpD family alkylhydroperoxidase
MAKVYKEITKDISEYINELRKLQPEAMAGFSALASNASKNNLLDKKTKEFVALGIAISTRCDGCIGFHVKALKDLGATREEVSEVCAMGVYMGGGPSLMYAADVLRAFDEFSK